MELPIVAIIIFIEQIEKNLALLSSSNFTDVRLNR
jgi:hypothetical protein